MLSNWSPNCFKIINKTCKRCIRKNDEKHNDKKKLFINLRQHRTGSPLNWVTAVPSLCSLAFLPFVSLSFLIFPLLSVPSSPLFLRSCFPFPFLAFPFFFRSFRFLSSFRVRYFPFLLPLWFASRSRSLRSLARFARFQRRRQGKQRQDKTRQGKARQDKTYRCFLSLPPFF